MEDYLEEYQEKVAMIRMDLAKLLISEMQYEALRHDLMSGPEQKKMHKSLNLTQLDDIHDRIKSLIEDRKSASVDHEITY